MPGDMRTSACAVVLPLAFGGGVPPARAFDLFCLPFVASAQGCLCLSPRSSSGGEAAGCGISSGDGSHSAYMGPCNLGHMRRLLEVNLGCGQECCQPARCAHYAGTAGSLLAPRGCATLLPEEKASSVLAFRVFEQPLVAPRNKCFGFSRRTYCKSYTFFFSLIPKQIK